MQDLDYPALFGAADEAAIKAQKSLLRCQKVNAFLLVAAALLSLLSTETRWLAIVSAILFLASLSSYMYGKYKNFQSVWYQARALAESAKTATWRLIMGAEPFAEASQTANLKKFENLLKELLEENQGIGAHLAGDWSAKPQITPEMIRVLSLSFKEKKDKYLPDRIIDQRTWYAKKSGENQRDSQKYFAFLCGAYSVAIILLFVRIAWPQASYLPIDLFAVIASSIIAWKEIKRFDDLASSYGLAAHEVGIIEVRYSSVTNSDQLSQFVGDAENAFSREHTQWAARRNN